jgi:hypothetical protein
MLLADEAPCIVTATKGRRGQPLVTQPTPVHKSRDEIQSREWVLVPRFRFGFCVPAERIGFHPRTSILHPPTIPPERTQ